jgi:hypothetical protein
MTEVFKTHIEIARPSGNDPGTIEQSHYVIEGGDLVVLSDRSGTPLVRETIRRRVGDPILTRWERKLNKDEPHGRCARQLLWQRWNATKRGSSFNRRIDMSQWGRIA